MAFNVVFSTLMVLLSKSEEDFKVLWDTTGAVNDPLGNKHEQALQGTIQTGNFRSALIDNWLNLTFDSVSLYGMNMFGDIFWETEFNVTDTASAFSSWLVGENIISSSTDDPGSQASTFSDEKYRVRISPANNMETAWFAVSYIDLSYGPLPQIFVPRNPSTPFSIPVFMDGSLGCWYLSTLINVVFMYENSTDMTPDACISECWDNYTVAMLAEKKKCYCADVDASNPPANQILKCYLICSGAFKFCGGFDVNVGNAYHVQGNNLPGFIDTVKLHQEVYANVNTSIQINGFELNAASTLDTAFITKIAVNVSNPLNYTIKYHKSKCSEAVGLKDLSFDGNAPSVFQADGNISDVDILKVGCIEIVFSQATFNVGVELWGPNVTYDYVETPALVIRGKTLTPVTTTVSTTTLSPTSTTNSTPSPTSASPSTTSTSPSTIFTSTSTSPSATSTSPSTTSTSHSTTSTFSSPTTAASQASSNSACFCPCQAINSNLTEEQLQVKIIEIQKNLSLKVSQLSSSIRKLTSAGDTRVSAVSIGYIGVAILAIAFIAVVIIDSAMLFKHMKQLLYNIKTCLGSKNEYRVT